MLIKYATPDEGLQLTEIVDVTLQEGSAVFSVSSDSGLTDIAIEGVSEEEYNGIVHSLFATGKADLVCYADRTFYCEDDEDEEEEEDDAYDYDDDDDFLSGLMQEAVDEVMLGGWIEQLLKTTKKTSIDDLTEDEIQKEIEDIKGTIKNEKVLEFSHPTRLKNVFRYLEILEEMKNHAKKDRE